MSLDFYRPLECDSWSQHEDSEDLSTDKLRLSTLLEGNVVSFTNNCRGINLSRNGHEALTSIIRVRQIFKGPPFEDNKIEKSIDGGFSVVHCVNLSESVKSVRLLPSLVT